MAKFAVVQFPGTNCERETTRVLQSLLGQQVDLVWHGDRGDLDGFDCVVLPGGFSHGDHLRAGALARFSPIMSAVSAFAEAGGLTLGICNGFQILLEAGLLPGAMLRNAGLQFRSVWVWCRVERTDTPFTQAFASASPRPLRLPVAHGEGNFVLGSEADLSRLEERGGVLFRYVDSCGRTIPQANPNGSTANIAGIVNEAGNVCGLMPHPERASEALLGSEDGRGIFTSIVQWLERQAGAEPVLAGSGRGRA